MADIFDWHILFIYLFFLNIFYVEKNLSLLEQKFYFMITEQKYFLSFFCVFKKKKNLLQEAKVDQCFAKIIITIKINLL